MVGLVVATLSIGVEEGQRLIGKAGAAQGARARAAGLVLQEVNMQNSNNQDVFAVLQNSDTELLNVDDDSRTNINVVGDMKKLVFGELNERAIAIEEVREAMKLKQEMHQGMDCRKVVGLC